jgi:pimeloyl-ACP methyl ester carboxylesterase
LPHPHTLVLLPGLDGTGDLFKPFVDALRPDVATLTVNYSSPPQSSYEACLDTARLKLPRQGPFFLLGESFSGPIAIALAAARPPGLQGVILVGTFVTTPSPWLRWIAPLLRFTPTGRLPAAAMNHSLLGRFATSALQSQLHAAIAKVDPAIYRGRLMAIAKVNARADLTRVSVPMVYFRATHDRLVPPSASAELARLHPQLQIIDFDAPHMLLQCAPTAAARAAEEFMDRVGGSSGI